MIAHVIYELFVTNEGIGYFSSRPSRVLYVMLLGLADGAVVLGIGCTPVPWSLAIRHDESDVLMELYEKVDSKLDDCRSVPVFMYWLFDPTCVIGGSRSGATSVWRGTRGCFHGQ